jgi:pentatricopeptide repeat protein
MKAQGIKPDIHTYNSLIRACGGDGLTKHATAIFEDMLAVGLQPERETFHLLFKVCSSAYIDPALFADVGAGPLTKSLGNSPIVLE